jgi:tetratricopeptide (TPR) repeat protein
MPEPLLVLLGLVVAGAFVLVPLRRSATDAPAVPDEAEAVRHRAALEALRDVEADRRAGTLDEVAYARELAAAESRAAETRAALDAAARASGESMRSDPRARRTAGVVAGVIGLLLVGGAIVPATGIGNTTVIDEQLAARQRTEDERQARIDELTERLAADPSDTITLSDLADAYLAGSTREDLASAVRALQVLLAYEPQNASAYERVVSAYVRADDWANARAALDSYTAVGTADPIEVAFLTGLVAWRGEGDAEAAVAAFDRFLELAPDDPRASMIRGLREEAAATR